MRFSLLVIAAVLTTSAVPKHAAAETIEVHGCDPGKILLENGDAWTCIDDPSGGGGPGGGGGGGGGGDGGGGGTSNPLDGWDQIDVQEQVRKWRCAQCKTTAQSCLAKAELAEDACIENFAIEASRRCTMERRGGNTITAWGCSIDSHLVRDCAGVEPPWNSSSRWVYECKPGKFGMTCSGPGINSCKTSWAQSHPGGTNQVVDSYELHAEFEKVGGASASKTITATCNLTTATGYNAACTSAGSALMTGCTDQQTACYSAYSCTAADFPK